MNNKFIPILSVFMTISLIVFVSLQFYWLKEYYASLEQEFSNKVHIALENSAQKISEIEFNKYNEKFKNFDQTLTSNAKKPTLFTVQQTQVEIKPTRTKIKTVVEVIKRYQKTDPALLLELAKIGNNLNQIARALNIIKNADHQEQRKLDIFSVLLVLKGIQTELEKVFPALPKISRQSPERLKKQLSSVQLAEEDESAY